MTLGPRTVLVVEDQVLNRELVTDLLEAEGYRVLHAGDGEEALAKARGDLPDLILMDIALPGLSGLEATRSLKSDPATRHIPIAILTALAMKSDEERAREHGCDAFFSKPINTRTFLVEVARLLGGEAGR